MMLLRCCAWIIAIIVNLALASIIWVPLLAVLAWMAFAWWRGCT